MGIASFFKNAFNLVKRGATKILPHLQKLPQVIKPYVPKAIDTVKRFSGEIFKLPEYMRRGKEIYDNGKEVVNRLVDVLPNGKVKNNINDAVNRFDNTAQNIYNKASDGIQRFNNISQPLVNRGLDIARRFA